MFSQIILEYTILILLNKTTGSKVKLDDHKHNINININIVKIQMQIN